jgi:hypothetical protein
MLMKYGNKLQRSIYITEDQDTKLREAAERANVLISAFICLILTKHLERKPGSGHSKKAVNVAQIMAPSTELGIPD